ncbi:ParA family protein [Streptomyces sp. NBC_01422]|uniref:ParA family protein n=1 Tax=Streptomyces sp. NBC_01422 TaxID=2903859 RepID=UPI002E2864EE|nr:ParA family protein [Streptomyces sp. NBC_01422]
MANPQYQGPAYAPDLSIPIFVMMNRAGSVGKTTVANTVFTEAALRGYRGLVFDADLQTDMSYWSGYDGDDVPRGVQTIHDLMLGNAKLEDVVVPARTRIAPGDSEDSFQAIEGLDLVRGDIKMKQADGELVQDSLGVFWLQNVIKKQIAVGAYDFIVIDAPASYARLSESLLVAATDVITMMKPMRKELRGARALARELESLNVDYADYGARVRPTWYCVNDAKSESQGRFFSNMHDEAEEVYGDRLLPGIKNAVVVAEAFDAQEPLPIWAPKSESMKVFRDIADQIGFPEK